MGELHNQGVDYIAENLLCFERLPSDPRVIINLASHFVSKSNLFGQTPLINLEVTSTYALNYYLLGKYPKDFTED